MISAPATSKESRKFWAWAGAWLPHPITPMLFIPSKAAGSLSKRFRPPRRIVSVVSANFISSVSNTSDLNLLKH